MRKDYFRILDPQLSLDSGEITAIPSKTAILPVFQGESASDTLPTTSPQLPALTPNACNCTAQPHAQTATPSLYPLPPFDSDSHSPPAHAVYPSAAARDFIAHSQDPRPNPPTAGPDFPSAEPVPCPAPARRFSPDARPASGLENNPHSAVFERRDGGR